MGNKKTLIALAILATNPPNRDSKRSKKSGKLRSNSHLSKSERNKIEFKFNQQRKGK